MPEPHPRILCVGVYLADVSNTAHHVTDILLRSKTISIDLKWTAITLKGMRADVPGTMKVVTERTPKCVLINELIEDIEPYDWILICDDDIELNEGFADAFIAMAQKYDFALLQPARTPDSYIDHPIVGKFPGLLARRTRFVEIGPLICIRRDAAKLLLPFPAESPMGWGLDFVWPRVIEDAGLKMGIIDATPIAHRIRAPVTGYNYDAANTEMAELLAMTPHLSTTEAFQILEAFAE